MADTLFENRKNEIGRKGLVIGWKVSSIDINIASVRYRAILPSLVLESNLVCSRLFDSTSIKVLKGIDILVIVKCVTEKDIILAQRAKLMGIPVVIDLCDNIFVPGYIIKSNKTPIDLFKALAEHSVAITTTTTPLSKVIEEILGTQIPVYVIPDGSEEPKKKHIGNKPSSCFYRSWLNSIWERGFGWKEINIYLIIKRLCSRAGKVYTSSKLWLRFSYIQYWRMCAYIEQKVWKFLKDRSNLKFLVKITYYNLVRIRKLIKTKKGGSTSTNQELNLLEFSGQSVQKKRILWFGNHGASYARFGMSDLLEIKKDLERIATEIPVELLVISSNKPKYDEYIKPLAISSSYITWSHEAMEQAFSVADVVVIPNSCDAFSICKSSNRTILALSHGIPVVATGTPALLPFSKCVEMSGFYLGLKRYLTSPDYAKDHVSLAKKIINNNFGNEKIAFAWKEVISHITQNNSSTKEGDVEVVLCLDLIQDLELATPILEGLLHSKVSCQVWLSTQLMLNSRNILHMIHDMGVSWRVLPNSPVNYCQTYFSKTVKAVMAIAESNLKAHRFSHKIIEYANELGLQTYCMQHGFENVGLTYTDNIQPIEFVSFAAKNIFIWGAINSLHPRCPQQTKLKCIPVGYPKKAKQCVPSEIRNIFSSKRKVIGVFENLHWHRYSNAYREFFINSIVKLAKGFPDKIFLLKEHPAGLWLSSSKVLKNLDIENLIVVDNTQFPWSSCSSGQILNCLEAVITTPSTIALDAAVLELPVCVIGHDYNLDRYKPLITISKYSQLQHFVHSLAKVPGKASMIDLSRRLTGTYLENGNAVQLIVKNIDRTLKANRKLTQSIPCNS